MCGEGLSLPPPAPRGEQEKGISLKRGCSLEGLADRRTPGSNWISSEVALGTAEGWSFSWVYDGASVCNNYDTVEPLITDPPTRGQPLYKGHYSYGTDWNYYVSTQKQPPTSGPSWFRTADKLCAPNWQTLCKTASYKETGNHTYIYVQYGRDSLCYCSYCHLTGILQTMKECFISWISASSLASWTRNRIYTDHTFYKSLIWQFEWTSHQRTTSEKRTKALLQKCPLFGGSTVLHKRSYMHQYCHLKNDTISTFYRTFWLANKSECFLGKSQSARTVCR